MSSRRYVGRAADDPHSISYLSYDQSQSGQGLTQAQIDASVQSQLSGYATRAYVDQQDALKATSAYVSNGDTAKIKLAQRGAADGAAPLDSSGLVPVANLNAGAYGWQWTYSGSGYNTGVVTVSSTATFSLLATITVNASAFWNNGISCFPLIFGYWEARGISGTGRPLIEVRLGGTTGTLVAKGMGVEPGQLPPVQHLPPRHPGHPGPGVVHLLRLRTDQLVWSDRVHRRQPQRRRLPGPGLRSNSMSSLRYYGKKADSDASVTTKGYADERRAAVSVTQTDVNNEVARQSNGLATKTYVNQQDATLADKSYVDTQDAKYANATLLGAASGVAKLNASSKLSGAPLLSLAPRGPRIYTVNTGMSSYTNQTSQNVLLTSISIADPGYTYFPMVFGTFECITNSGADTRIDLGGRWKLVVGHDVHGLRHQQAR